MDSPATAGDAMISPSRLFLVMVTAASFDADDTNDPMCEIGIRAAKIKVEFNVRLYHGSP